MKTRLYLGDVGVFEEEALFESCLEKMIPERKRKVEKMKFRKDQMLSLGAGVLYLKALSDTGLDAWTERTGTKENGKPYLIDHPGFHFNLSHSGTKVICAVSDHEIGCDVETQKTVPLSVAKRFFRKEEYEDILEQTDPVLQRIRFLTYWTLKESFLKATGRGLSMPMNSFLLKLKEDGTAEVEQEYSQQTYSMKTWLLGEDCAASVCEESEVIDCELKVVDFETEI